MKVEETRVFSFWCPYLDGTIKGFAVAADDQKQATAQLKEWFSKAQLELSMLFPQIAPEPVEEAGFNQLQMGLLEDLAVSIGFKPAQSKLADFIRENTELEMTVKNFKFIVPILENIKEGKPVKKPKDGKKEG